MKNYDELSREIFRYKTIYHITDIRNVLSVVNQKRLLSNRIINKYGYSVNRIDNPEINNYRKSKIITGSKTSLDEYVPFFINPRNAFLRLVTDDGKVQNVVMLGYKYELPKGNFYYTDGNAASKRTIFFKDLEKIKKNIDVETIKMKWENLRYAIKEEYDELKRKHQSEFLIHRMVHIDDINHIVVCNETQLVYLQNQRVSIPIYCVPEMFFGKIND